MHSDSKRQGQIQTSQSVDVFAPRLRTGRAKEKVMAEYVKVIDLLGACVEAEYLGRPRMMVSASKIAQLPSVEITLCCECRYCDTDAEAPSYARDYCGKHQRYVTPNYYCGDGKAVKE